MTEGRPPFAETLRTLSREGLQRGRDVARDLSARGRAGVAKASGRWDRLRSHVPGLRRRAPPRAGRQRAAASASVTPAAGALNARLPHYCARFRP